MAHILFEDDVVANVLPDAQSRRAGDESQELGRFRVRQIHAERDRTLPQVAEAFQLGQPIDGQLRDQSHVVLGRREFFEIQKVQVRAVGRLPRFPEVDARIRFVELNGRQKTMPSTKSESWRYFAIFKYLKMKNTKALQFNCLPSTLSWPYRSRVCDSGRTGC